MCVAFIGALQAGGVGASLKHFVGNDSEFERHSISSEIDERTLREVYLRPFEAAVAEVDPWTIMAAYNKLNGTHATEHRWLQVELLKQEWGWPGVVVSDWYATHDTVASGNGGLDLQMPGPAAQFGPALAQAVRDGDVDEAELEDKARRVLRLYARTGKLDEPGEVDETSVDTPERRALARRAAAASMVLLRNDGARLPLATDTTVAVIGPNATPGRIQGGGSSEVTPHYSVSPLEGIEERFDDVTYVRGVGVGLFGPPLDPGLLEGEGFAEELFATPDLSGEPYRTSSTPEAALSFFGAAIPQLGLGSFSARWTGRVTPEASGPWTLTVAAAGAARVLVDGTVVIDDQERGPKMAIWVQSLEPVSATVDLEAGRTHEVVVELLADERGILPHLRFAAEAPEPGHEVERAVAAAEAADVAVVVVGTSSDYETEGEDRTSFALPGGQDELVARVAAANPETIVVVNAGSPIPMPWLDQVKAVLWTWYPGQEFGHALADVLTGDADPGGRLPHHVRPAARGHAGLHQLPGRVRCRSVRRGHLRRSPLVRRPCDRAAVPVRARVVLRDGRDRRCDGRGRRRRVGGPRGPGDQRRRTAGRRGGPGLRRGPARPGGPATSPARRLHQDRARPGTVEDRHRADPGPGPGLLGPDRRHVGGGRRRPHPLGRSVVARPHRMGVSDARCPQPGHPPDVNGERLNPSRRRASRRPRPAWR